MRRRLGGGGWSPLAVLPRRFSLIESVGQTPVSADAGLATLPALFEAKVAQAPEAAALLADGRRLTYAQLDAAANRYAHFLIARGVGPETRVGLALTRSARTIAALLGVLKAGGAYLPLDPALPPQRLALMIEDAAPACVLTTSDSARRLRGAAPVLCVDEANVGVQLERGPARAPTDADRRAPLTAQTLAYVIYTSGSTGVPKGVMTTHANVASLARTPLYAPLGPGQSILQFAPLAFDAATFEIWGALLNGARLVLAPPGSLDLDRLASAVIDNRIDTLWLTASLFRQAAASRPHMFRGLRRLLIGGEAAPAPAVRAIMERYPTLVILNAYGPTETTTFACTRLITPEDARSDRIPIGSPIRNTRCYVLDERLSPVEDGEAGELYIAGDGVAGGYLNRPDLTAQRFVACPFEPGRRMYRTGDLVRRRADAALDFLGRTDQQIKIRGHRVEPGEIESALAAIDDVGQAVVVARPIAGETRLVAYVVPRPGAEPPPAAALRAALAARLPDYMLPAAFMPLDRLPLTENGKLDHAALPAPRQGVPNGAPLVETALERRLAALFCTVLRLEAVGAAESFFDLGGDSLLGVQLALEVEQRLGKRLTLGEIYGAPTIRQLAGVLGAGRAAATPLSLVPLHIAGEGEPVFIVHWIERDLARRLGERRPVYGLCFGLSGSTARRRPRHPDAIEALAAHYIEEMRGLQPLGPYRLIGHSGGGLIAFEMAHQLLAQGQPVALLAMLDVDSPLPEAMASPVPIRRQIANLARMPPSMLLRRGLEMTQDWISILVLLARNSSVSPSATLAQRIYLFSRAAKTYRVKPYPGHIHYFKAMSPLQRFRSGRVRASARDWIPLAAGGMTVHEIDGDHSSIVKDPLAAEVAAKIEGVC
jgi:amino acid adenylation domain-containing protein